MDALVHRRAAPVDPDRARRRRQLDERARERVVEAHGADRSQAVRSSASPRGSAARTAASSGPRSAPVSASRSERRSPPTALSSRRIAFASSRDSCSGAAPRSSANRVERRPSVVGKLDRLGRDDEACVLPRLGERARAAKRGDDLDGRVRCGSELLVRHRSDRIDREPAKPREIELDVVLGQIELVEIRPHRRGRKALLAKLRDRGMPVALRELLPVRSEHEPVVDHLRQLSAERAGDALLHGKVRAVIRAADDVRDAEVEIVCDGCELVRRSSVRPEQGRAVAPEPHGPVVVAIGRRRSPAPALRPRRTPHPARSAAPALRRSRPRARRDRRAIASSPPSTFRAGSVSSIRSTTTPPCESAKRRLATAVSAFPRWSEPVGLGAKRTRTDTVYASIGTWPGCDATRSSHARVAGVRLEVEAALVRDVRVRVERDVRERVALADEEGPSLEMPLHRIERRVPALHACRKLCAAKRSGVPE